MDEILKMATVVEKLGPSAILAVGLMMLSRWYQQKDKDLAASQDARVKAAEAYAQEKRTDSKENTQALLAVADRANQAIDRFETATRQATRP